MSQDQNSEQVPIAEPIEPPSVAGEVSDDGDTVLPVAEIIEPVGVVASPSSLVYFEPPQIPNVAAIGGAVASCMLGALSIIGILVSSMSIVNGFLAICFGFWGLYSPRKRLAFLGMILGITGVLLNIGKILIDLTLVFERLAS